MTDVLVSVQLLRPKKGTVDLCAIHEVLLQTKLSKHFLRAGVFEDHIQYLLALISQSEVRLLGVAFSKARGELTMYLTQISVPTDGVVMLSAHALSTGQLIMGGQDGHLYELEYEVRRHVNVTAPLILSDWRRA